MKQFSLICMFIFTAVNASANEANEAEVSQIKKVIAAFVASGDKRDTALAEQSLHPEFHQYLDLGRGVMKTTRDQYVQALIAKKIGGDTRTFDIDSLRIIRNTAAAAVTISGSKLVFNDLISLMKVDNQWRIVNITMSVTRK